LRDNLGIELHSKKWSLQEVHKGVPFIGSVIKPWGIYAGNRLVNNAFAAVLSVSDPETYVKKLNSYLGFLIHNLTYGIRWRMWKAVPEEIKKRIVCFGLKKVKVRKIDKIKLSFD